MDMKNGHGNHNHREIASARTGITQTSSQLAAVINSYFLIKDALVKSDAALASTKSNEMIAAIKAVAMNKLSAEEHPVWMKVMKGISGNAASISRSGVIGKQREAFAALAENIYELAKVSKLESPVYYQHCSMYNGGKGANWLSKESSIKNPYYGSQMLTCGKVEKTIGNK